jgi:formamidopyrimidine-DNA glycosylase
MPELPEVETVRSGLTPVLVGRRFTDLEARRPDLRFPLPEKFRERVAGQKIVALDRRAKYLIAALSGGEDLVVHLGMTGRFTILRDGARETPGEYAHDAGANPAHDHVVLHLSDGTRIVYNDPRRFGFMMMMPHAERDAHALFRNLGVEPLGNQLTTEYLASRGRGKKANLKSFLMDQRVIAGLGNIYASEALYRAGLSPSRSAGSLADRQPGQPSLTARRCDPRRSSARDRCRRIDAA